MTPFISGWVYYPVNKLNDLVEVKQELTVKPVHFKGGEKPKLIKVYDDVTYDGYIGLPKRYAIDRLKSTYGALWMNRVDDLSASVPTFNPPRLPDLEHELAHKDQPVIAQQVREELESNYNSLFIADTGVGKTAIALYVAGVMKQKPLILVKSEKLKEQWIQAIQDLMGISRSDIGIVQGTKCEVDKDILIGMVQTVYKGKFNEKLRSQVGIVIFDEVHNLGADEFSKCLGAANSKYSLAMTATDDRPDGKDEVYKFHFGRGDVRADAEALPIKVHVIPYTRLTGANWGNNRNAKILCVSKDFTRNMKIAQLIVQLAKAGRNVLIFSEYKRHLKTLFELAVKYGLDPKVAGHVYIGSGVMQSIAKLPLELKEKDYHQHCLNNSQIIFTVYGQMREGVSCNRMDTGIDATPQARAKQLIGRVRRPYENKKLSLWYTIHDTDDKMLSGFCQGRIREYRADRTVELVRHDGGS